MTLARNLSTFAANVNSSGTATVPTSGLTGTIGATQIANTQSYNVASLKVGSAGITFNDSTTLTSTPVTGSRGQVFSSTGTFTIPTGVTAIKVTVVGGGGGSIWNPTPCSATPGGSGGTSSISSGTQTISTVSATGGSGGYANGSGGGGSGSGGDINTSGWNQWPGGGPASSPSIFGSGSSPGAGGSGNNWPGAAGGAAIKFFTGLTPGNTIAVTVGGGGSSGLYPGSAGVVVFEW